MFDFKLNHAKTWFLDSPRMANILSKNARRGLMKFGSYCRVIARNSIKRKRGVSAPGDPPYAHDGEIKKIYFAYQPQSKSVIVGPAKSNIVFLNGDRKPVLGTVPRVLESGGEIGIIEVFNSFSQKWVRRDLRYKHGWRVTAKQRTRKVRIAARPFMMPALEKSQPKLPEYLRNTLTRS